MADIYELTLSLTLSAELSQEELAELEWHLGLNSQPDVLRIVTEFPFVEEDDNGDLVIENDPRPLLAEHGEASKVDGTLSSTLVLAHDGGAPVWKLTSRQEIHPDDFELIGALLGWLAARTVGQHIDDDAVEIGQTRFYEEQQAEPLLVRGGAVMWPS